MPQNAFQEAISLPQSCCLYLDSMEVSTTPLTDTATITDVAHENAVLRAGDPSADGGDADRKTEDEEEQEEELFPACPGHPELLFRQLS